LHRLLVIFSVVIFLLSGCGQNADNQTKQISTSALPLVTSRQSDINTLMKSLHNENVGVVQWVIRYAGNNKVLFSNERYLLSYDQIKQEIIGAVNLQAIDGGLIQGSDVTFFDISPDGNSVIINNGCLDESTPCKYKMYAYDIEKATLSQIDEQNYTSLITSWSNNSLYYVYAEKTSHNLKIIKRGAGTTQTVSIPSGKIKSLYVSDTGDVIVNIDQKYLISSEKDYASTKKLPLSGELLGFRNGAILYLKDGNIRSFTSEKDIKMKTIGKSYHQINSKNGGAMFTDNSTFLAYRYIDNKTFTFDGIEPKLSGFWSLSPNQERLFVVDGSKYEVIDHNGNSMEIPAIYSYDCKWLDDNMLVQICPTHENPKVGDFKILGYNLDTQKETTLRENSQ